ATGDDALDGGSLSPTPDAGGNGADGAVTSEAPSGTDAVASNDAPSSTDAVAPNDAPSSTDAVASNDAPTVVLDGIDWPAIPPVAPPPPCGTADVPFNEHCPRAPLDCKLTLDDKRVHCACDDSNRWWCFDGDPKCFDGLSPDAGCAAPARCERGDGLAFESCV